MDEYEWSRLTPKEKRIQLFRNQKSLLDQFLRTGAITQAQYDRSLGDLTRKMGMEGVE